MISFPLSCWGGVGDFSLNMISTIENFQPTLLILELGKEARGLNDKRKIYPSERGGGKKEKKEGRDKEKKHLSPKFESPKSKIGKTLPKQELLP